MTGLPVMLAVPFNVIGPGQAEHLVPATFIRQLLATPGDGPVRIAVGDVTAERDWIDVRDVAQALVVLAARGRGGAYNICTGRAQPVSALLNALQAASPRRFDWAVDPARLRPGQPSIHYGDPARIAAVLPEHRAAHVDAARSPRAKLYVQREHLRRLGAPVESMLTTLVHRRPRAWSRDVEQLHELLLRHGDAAFLAAVDHAARVEVCGAEYVAHFLDAAPAREVA